MMCCVCVCHCVCVCVQLLEELCVCVRSVEELASVPRLMALRLLLRDPSLQVGGAGGSEDTHTY